MMNMQTLFFREKSFECFDDRSVLELMLSTAGVRGNIPEIIQKLYDTFGSFKGILEARPFQLMQVSGVTEKTAMLVSMIVPLAKVWERSNLQNPCRLTNRHEAESYCKSLLMGERTEQFYVICVNAQCNVLGARKIGEGTINEVNAHPRLVAETALNFNAHSVFFCHNHPGGTCAPSHEDIVSTTQLQRMLNSMGIAVLDHIIVAGANTYSMAQHGDIDYRMRGAA